MSVIKMNSLADFAQAIQGYAFVASSEGKVPHFEISGDIRSFPVESAETPYQIRLAFLRRGIASPQVEFVERYFVPSAEYRPTQLLTAQYADLGVLLTQGPRPVTFEQISNPLRFRVMVPSIEQHEVVQHLTEFPSGRTAVPVSPSQGRSLFAAMRAALQ